MKNKDKFHAYMKYVAELSYLLYSIENVAYIMCIFKIQNKNNKQTGDLQIELLFIMTMQRARI